MSLHNNLMRILKYVPIPKKYEIIRSPRFLNQKLVDNFVNKFIKSTINRKPKISCVALELTNRCNADCKMCPYKIMKRKKGAMSFELFKKIVKELDNLGIEEINLVGMGEQTIDPSIIEKIYHTKKNTQLDVILITNGSLIDNKFAKELVQAGIDKIFFSIDDFSKTGYEKIRKNLSFEKVINNIKNLHNLKNKLGIKKPEIIIRVVNLDKTKKDFKNDIVYKKLKKIANSFEFFPHSSVHNWAVGTIKNIRLKNYCKKVIRKPCKYLWNSLTVLWDGRVTLCTMDYEGENIIGNLNRQSISEVLNSNELKKFRMMHYSRRFDKIDVCKDCLLRVEWLLPDNKV